MKIKKDIVNRRVGLGRESWSPRSTPLPPQQPKVSFGEVPDFASAVIPQKVAFAASSLKPNMAQVSLSVSSIVKGLSHQNKAKVTAAENSSTENTSVQPSTTEIIKPATLPPTAAAAERGVPLPKKTYVPPLTPAVERDTPLLNTRAISPSTDAVGMIAPALSNAAPPSKVLANKVVTPLNDAEILTIAVVADKILPKSSTGPNPSPTSALAQITSPLNKTAAIKVEKISQASSPVPAASTACDVAQTSPRLDLTAGTAGKKISELTNTTPALYPTSALARISPEKPTAATGVEKSSQVSDTGPVSIPVVVGKLSARPEMAHLDPSSFSGAEGHLKKNINTSPLPLTSTNKASSINQTLIPPKSGAGAKFVPAQNLSSSPPPLALAANVPPVQIKPPVLPASTSVAKIASDGNLTRISALVAVPKPTSKLKAAPDTTPTAVKTNPPSNRNIAPVLSAPDAVLNEASTAKPAAELTPAASAAKVTLMRNTVPVPRSTAAIPKTTRSKAAPAIPPSTPTRNTTIRNKTSAPPSPETGPSATSKLEAAPAVSLAASTADVYSVQKPIPASQPVRTALNESKSLILAPLVSASKVSPPRDIFSALAKAVKGLGNLKDSAQVQKLPQLSPRRSVDNEASQKNQTERERLRANIDESFKIFKTELESTFTEAVGKRGKKIAFLRVEIEDSKKIQCKARELLKMKQKTVASMDFVIKGLRKLQYGPQKLSEKEQQTSDLKCEIEGLRESLDSRGEQIKFREQELSTLNIELECLRKSYSSALKLEKAKDQNFAKLKVEIEKVKTSQKVADNLLDVKEHQIVALQTQVDACTESLQTAENMVDLKSKEILGLRAALAFKAETDELKNTRAKRDLDLLDKSLKRIKALELEIERLKKSSREKDKMVRNDQEVSTLKLEIERLRKFQKEKYVVGGDIAGKVKAEKSEKNKTELLGNSKDDKFKPATTKTSKMQAISKSAKPRDLRRNDLMGPLIYFTNDELGIPTYEMDFEGGSYVPNEQKEVEYDGPEPAIRAFTATGTGIQIHITKRISWRAIILLLMALLCTSLRKIMPYWKS